MPIRPENRVRYPKDWKQIAASIRERASNRCEGSPDFPDCRAENGQPHPVTGSRVVLTVAHPDHTPENQNRKTCAHVPAVPLELRQASPRENCLCNQEGQGANDGPIFMTPNAK